jgi:spore germination protein YaaH
VDVFVPQAWSEYYRRDLMGLTADFVCVMAYDEHFPGSANSGPVASLPFVFKGVTDMLEQVPKRQLILGLPFYNRIWIEQVNNDSPETRRVHHFSMDSTKALLNENNVTPEWDAFVGGFYGEFALVEDGETVLYRVWLEDEFSIAEKLKIYNEHDLAGVAGWRRGFENEKVQVLLKDATTGR